MPNSLEMGNVSNFVKIHIALTITRVISKVTELRHGSLKSTTFTSTDV